MCSLKCQLVWDGMPLIERVPAVYRDPGRFEMVRHGLASGVIVPDARGDEAWVLKPDLMDLPACVHFANESNSLALKKRCEACRLYKLNPRKITYAPVAS